MKLKLYSLICIAGGLAICTSCNKKNDYSPTAQVVRDWNFNLSSSNENTVSTGQAASALFHMIASNDNSISYDIKLDGLPDRVSNAQINLGDPVSEGALLLNLPIRIYSTYASGVITGLRPGLIDTLLNNNIEKYINVGTEKAPAGLVRGQLNSNIVLSQNVPLTGSATATGTAFVRLASNNTLYSKVVVNNDPTNPAMAATINQGAAGNNGPVLVNIVSSPQEFGIGKKTTVSASVYSTLLNNRTYVNVTSAGNPNGLLRGQIR